ncbi:class Ia ribonucleoside-diphosphate reductase subunit beta [Snodgrassella sp. ESL0324]|uniref:class Ia ribonucleoside-diphosphate reductase subunit beta n=1 Tax=Snodgrassella sp. ESL0324 TaxID=2705033 RepID=UPI001EEAD69E
MFFGQSVNVARYDQQKYLFLEKLTEKQLSFFWRPEEIDVSRDRSDFASLPEHEKHIFISNLKYQILLDSIQGRSPSIAFLPICSLPELETWVTTWTFSETIHSRSYTHIIRNIFTDPSVVFNDIMDNKHILARADEVAVYYDDLIAATQDWIQGGTDIVPTMKKLYLCLMCVNVLEAIRFYVSFACSFAFAERELMEGNAKIIKLIARDEALHLTGTQQMLNNLRNGSEGELWKQVANECQQDSVDIFQRAVQQEIDWAEYLFKDGSMIGLNKTILTEYIKFISGQRMQVVGLPDLYRIKQNPIPWINSWLSSDNVQVAPQEVEISSYLVGQIDAELNEDDLSDFEL